MEPEVLLLDEPLSNLDAKLRMNIRADLRAAAAEDRDHDDLRAAAGALAEGGSCPPRLEERATSLPPAPVTSCIAPIPSRRWRNTWWAPTVMAVRVPVSPSRASTRATGWIPTYAGLVVDVFDLGIKGIRDNGYLPRLPRCIDIIRQDRPMVQDDGSHDILFLWDAEDNIPSAVETRVVDGWSLRSRPKWGLARMGLEVAA